MKNTAVILLSVALVGVVLYFVLANKGGTIATDANQTDADSTGANKDGTPNNNVGCVTVPSNFPPYTQEVVPKDVQQAVWNNLDDESEKRLRGFFKAANVEAKKYVVDYFGKSRINEYLDTPTGKLPYSLVESSSLRCKNSKKALTYRLL